MKNTLSSPFLIFLLAISINAYAAVDIERACAKREIASHYYLPANDKTVHWGYFSKKTPPDLMVQSGDFVTVEVATHHAGDDYDRMIKGDKGMESIYGWTKDKKNVATRGPGVHILTGPIAICGVRPGDIVEVRILKMQPRPSQNPLYKGKAFGSNAAAWWGYLYNHYLTDPKPREVITIYEADTSGQKTYAKALYNYTWQPQTDPDGIVHNTINYPGVIVNHNTIKENWHVLPSVRIPLRPYLGTIGLTPVEADTVDSIPPGYFGGNMDDRRIGENTTLYLPAAVPYGLLNIGDPHAVQGDSELSGTAIEMSMNIIIQIIVHPKENLQGTILQGLDYPLLETNEEYVIHGFTYPNYLKELGTNAQKEIYQQSSIDKAYMDAVKKTRSFLMNAKGMTEDESVSFLSIATDFGITQVVDGNWGVHGIVKKDTKVNRSMGSVSH